MNKCIQLMFVLKEWIPAFAGMTNFLVYSFDCNLL